MPSKIPWTDETWPIVTGCSRVSAGCANCYAQREAAENDLDRPLIQQEEKARATRKDAWRAVRVEQLGLAKPLTKKLVDARLETLGLLSDLMQDKGTWWFKEIPGVGEGGAEKVSDAMADFWKSHPEFDD